jgi:FkbM family methyltransferase
VTIPEGFRVERGLLWPDTDIGAAQVLFGQVADIETVYRHCLAFDVAVQAGGNCGLWPREMAAKFGTVYTFEPDPKNFRCLAANAPAENIFKFNAALGNAYGCIGLHMRPDNVGAHKVHGSGNIPVMRIDDLRLHACDLIYLDIEGFESEALYGAVETIDAHKPVVVIEDKGCSESYGTPKGATAEWLQHDFGYRVAELINRDVILVPA